MNAETATGYLEQAVLDVLREARPEYVSLSDISERAGIFRERGVYTADAIAAGILNKLHSDGKVQYEYRVGWKLVDSKC